MRFNLIRISHSDQVYLNKPLALQRAQIHPQQPQHREKERKNEVIRRRKLLVLSTQVNCLKIRLGSRWFMIESRVTITSAQTKELERTKKKKRVRLWPKSKSRNWCPSSTKCNCRFPFDLSDPNKEQHRLHFTVNQSQRARSKGGCAPVKMRRRRKRRRKQQRNTVYFTRYGCIR